MTQCRSIHDLILMTQCRSIHDLLFMTQCRSIHDLFSMLLCSVVHTLPTSSQFCILHLSITAARCTYLSSPNKRIHAVTKFVIVSSSMLYCDKCVFPVQRYIVDDVSPMDGLLHMTLASLSAK